MITIQELKELMKLMDRSSLGLLELESDQVKVRIAKAETAGQQQSPVIQQPAAASGVASAAVPAAAQVAAAAEAPLSAPAPGLPAHPPQPDPKLHTITAPLVGTFYASPDPNTKPYVQIGDRVKPGSTVCIVEAMKLFNQIEAEVGGEIAEVLVKNGQMVEFGQPLFTLRTE
ncbi:acetyl-CoA carboxylase biotin carboxyl carrier protein [Paenibacillus sp. UNCCL117]|uniref:acetyl-CoA carboxylase biotin carboxyl carrier protein n=1 Tax=unclassified Paenibacillus TaxID=185978 RepID=UPI000890CD2C|nr:MULTISPECIES: acetyl-CoA carboxylase biotin carboxyl carrier protein [unclassified Paenibacillus]SDE56020.1 acetyl-CoA carboxylase biotin carboxyl carrier protein [Paenibacillus sp. cl123]SFW66289.1 acetyl-CoA carboxylase biotin carboxyl carrier protein [Paenibacillus sp. UNCCL117]